MRALFTIHAWREGAFGQAHPCSQPSHWKPWLAGACALPQLALVPLKHAHDSTGTAGWPEAERWELRLPAQAH